MNQPEFNIAPALIKPNLPTKVQQSGSYVKVLLCTPSPNVITITTDKGFKQDLLPGMGMKADFQYLDVSCANTVRNITALLYIGTVPLDDVTRTQPASTLTTVDMITLNAGGSGVQISGQLTIEGTTYRRKSITLANLDGALGVDVESLYTGRNGFTAVGNGFANNGGILPLPCADIANNRTFPVSLETDDVLILSNDGLGAARNVSILQTWVPIIT